MNTTEDYKLALRLVEATHPEACRLIEEFVAARRLARSKPASTGQIIATSLGILALASAFLLPILKALGYLGN